MLITHESRKIASSAQLEANGFSQAEMTDQVGAVISHVECPKVDPCHRIVAFELYRLNERVLRQCRLPGERSNDAKRVPAYVAAWCHDHAIF